MGAQAVGGAGVFRVNLLLSHTLVLVIIAVIWRVRNITGVPNGAQFAHVLFDHLAERPLHPVADALVEQLAVWDEQHLLDGGLTLGGAPPAVEELPAVGQVRREGGVAHGVLLAALAGLHAADPAGVAGVPAGQARLDGALDAQALLVLRAVAALQLGPVARVVEPDERVDAVARTLLCGARDDVVTG